MTTRLEPIHIEYINETKHALVIEDGSKFYPNDVVYHKSIDLMLQKLDDQDKKLFLLMCKVPPHLDGVDQRRLFYLNEKEFDDYCETSLKYLETSDSCECRFVKCRVMDVLPKNIFLSNWNKLVESFNNFSIHFTMNAKNKKIRENWVNRMADGFDKQEVARVFTMLELAGCNVARCVEDLSNLNSYQRGNQGRKVIMRVSSDNKMYYEDILEGCLAILEEEDREIACLQWWKDLRHQTDIPTIRDFEKFIRKMEIDENRFVLVPIIEKWTELPDPQISPKKNLKMKKHIKKHHKKELVNEVKIDTTEMLDAKKDYKTSKTKVHELNVKLGLKDKRIEKLTMRENAKNEQKRRNSDEDEKLKSTDKKMKKMKAELEMAKLTVNTNSKTIGKLEKEIGQLRIRNEFLEEQKAERIRELEMQCESLNLEKVGLLVDVEEVTAKNHELMVEIERLQRLPLRNHAQRCPICQDGIENENDNVPRCDICNSEYHVHCLAQWLGVNSICPFCRTHWPNPQEFLAL